MMQEIINELAERMAHGMRDFIGEQLAACGYGKDYVREHQHDFITVHMLDNPEGQYTESYIVHVPNERILFGVRRYTRLTNSDEMYGAKLNIHFERIEAHEATAEMWTEIQRCAHEAREQLEKSCPQMSREDVV